MSTPTPASAADLFALSQGSKNQGFEICHWCRSPCTDRYRHDEPAPVPFVRSTSGAKHYAGRYICEGCNRFRRPRCTVHFLDGGYKDRQDPRRHGWWVTAKGARAVGRMDRESLYELLLAPPDTFVCALLESDKDENLLHYMLINVPDQHGPLKFTLNNIPLSYTVRELQETLLNDGQGSTPGVRALTRLLGPLPRKREEVKDLKKPQRKSA